MGQHHPEACIGVFRCAKVYEDSDRTQTFHHQKLQPDFFRRKHKKAGLMNPFLSNIIKSAIRISGFKHAGFIIRTGIDQLQFFFRQREDEGHII